MSLSQFTKLYTNDAFLTRLQVHLQQLFDKLFDSPLSQGVLKEDVLVTTGQDNLISHGLGKSFQGFLVTTKNAEADVWESTTANNIPDRHIILKSSATVTCSFWFF